MSDLTELDSDISNVNNAVTGQFGFCYRGEIYPAGDCNNLTTTGFWNVQGGATNNPTSGWIELITFNQGNSANYGTQFAIPLSSSVNAVYMRHFTNGSNWTTWAQVI